MLSFCVHTKSKQLHVSGRAHLVEMFNKYSPLICYTTRCDHWISEDLECYLTAKVIGHLGFTAWQQQFQITDIETKELTKKNKVWSEYLLIHLLVYRRLSLG
jgi:hypothetical protein